MGRMFRNDARTDYAGITLPDLVLTLPSIIALEQRQTPHRMSSSK